MVLVTTWRLPQWRADKMVDFLIVNDVQISLSWCRGTFPTVQTFCRTTEISQLLVTVIVVPVCTVRAGL